MTENPTIKEIETAARTRVIHLSNGNRYIVNQTDPYGFWEIHMERGQMPQILKQKFTDFEYAKRAVECYLTTVSPQKEIVDSPVPLPPQIKYKPVRV